MGQKNQFVKFIKNEKELLPAPYFYNIWVSQYETTAANSLA